MTGDALGRAERVAWYTLAAVIPISRALIEVAATALILLWLARRWHARRWDGARPWPPPWFGRWLGGWLLAGVASLAAGTAWALGVRGLVKMAQAAATAWIGADLSRRAGLCQAWLGLLGVVAAVLVVDGVAQARLGTDVLRLRPLSVKGQVTGPFHTPNGYGGYLVGVFPMLVGLAATQWHERRRREAVLVAAVLGGILVALLLARSRGAWVGLVVGLAVVAGARRRWALAGGLVAALGVAMGLGLWGLGRELSFQDRLVMWGQATRMIAARPILGHGPNTYVAASGAYRDPVAERFIHGEHPEHRSYAHNCFLQMGAELGLVGLAMFVGLMGQVVANSWRALRAADGGTAWLLAGVLGGIAATLTHSVVDTNLYSLPLATFFWMSCGVAVGFTARAPVTESARGRG